MMKSQLLIGISRLHIERIGFKQKVVILINQRNFGQWLLSQSPFHKVIIAQKNNEQNLTEA